MLRSAPVNDWLDPACARLAAALGDDEALYALSEKDVENLLELARVAAHGSGDRTNAPLASYLVGLAHGRHPERTLRELIDAATGESGGG